MFELVVSKQEEGSFPVVFWPMPLSGEHKHCLGESLKEHDVKTMDIADHEHMSDGPSLEQLPCWMMESVHYSKAGSPMVRGLEGVAGSLML